MKGKRILILIMFLSVVCFLVSCAKENKSTEQKITYIENGGFETGDLSGWTVLSGDAFNDDCVSSRKSFTYSYDEDHKEISINQTGNWYLTGKGYDLSHSNNRTGVIKSSNFYLKEDGIISMKIAGGALKVEKGDNAGSKDKSRICYVGIYRASDDMMIAQQTNEYFLEHTESYVDVRKYKSGVYNTDNFYEYTLDLKEYVNEELYIKVVDNDTSVYYGYICVDDIKVGLGSESQATGTYYTKVRDYIEEVEAPSKYEIANGGFETGSLAGWEIISGDAFSNNGVNAESVWWNENISYSREGNFHYGHYNPSGVGVMRSSTFELGGSGYISFKLGGCSNNDLTYMRVMLKDDSGDYEIGRYSNFKYWNFQFPYVQNGMRLLNMNQYYVDLSQYIGKTLYIEVVDNNANADDLGCITLDSIQTYWEEKPVWYTTVAYECKLDVETEIEIESIYQVKNGTFETGNLEGWTTSWSSPDEQIGYVSSASTWWNEGLPYFKNGKYLFTGCDDEAKTGYLLSSPFEIGGTGFITFKMSGGKNPALCYVSVIDTETNTEIARYYNELFHDNDIYLIGKGSNLMNLISYKADLSEHIGKTVQLKLVDNATSDWGLVCFDSFITYHANTNSIPNKAYLLTNIVNNGNPEESKYQIKNGGFETGTLEGWTAEGEAILRVNHQTVWWNEMYSFNKSGIYFLNGWNVNEANKGSLTSEAFEVGGSGWITFKLGGGKNTDLCNIQIIDANTNEVLAIYGNTMFKEFGKAYYPSGKVIDLAKDGHYLANMVQYKADLSEFLGRNVKIKIVDNAESDWGLLFCDDFVTYYEIETLIDENARLAVNLK